MNIMMQIRRYRLFWWFVLVVSIISLVLITASTIITEPDGLSVVVDRVKSIVNGQWYEFHLLEIGTLARNDAISAVVIALFSALIATSVIYIFKYLRYERYLSRYWQPDIMKTFFIALYKKYTLKSEMSIIPF